MLPILLDLLDTNSDMELRPLTGLLRNLARHSPNKDHMGRTLLFLLFFCCFGPGTDINITERSKHLSQKQPQLFFFCSCSYKHGEGSCVEAAKRWPSENTVQRGVGEHLWSSQ